MLCKDEKYIWEKFMKTLLGESDFNSRYRIAKRKFVDNNEELICRAMLLDWMKAKAVHEDKLHPMVNSLKHNGLRDIADLCEPFVTFQKENLSDSVLTDIVKDTTMDPHALGKELNLDDDIISECIKQHPDDVKSQCCAVLMEWRETNGVINQGKNAPKYLRSLLDTSCEQSSDVHNDIEHEDGNQE